MSAAAGPNRASPGGNVLAHGIDAEFLRKVVAEAVQHALVRTGAPCDVPGALTDSCIATDGGSSATQEEPMYQRLYGPYFKRGRFHVHEHHLDGTKKYRTFNTEAEALEFVRANQPRVAGNTVTMKEAVKAYTDERKDLRASSRATLKFRLEALIRGHEGTPVNAFPAVTAWQKLAKDNAVDTLHGIRSAAGGFFRWCITKAFVKKNPLEAAEIVGQKNRGKEQLRMDEARSFLERALAVAAGQTLPGRTGSQQRVAVLGAATALLLGVRNGEVVARVVRDLDDGGKVLWIPTAKTRAGIRRVEVPPVLAAELLKLAEGRSPTDRLFDGATPDGLRYWTARLCTTLGVPRVTVHGLRGTHATASMQPHANPHAVAAALGHTSFAVTERHYADPQAVATARHQAALDTLLPPKEPSESKRLSKTSSKTFGREDGASERRTKPAA
jgi:integrase